MTLGEQIQKRRKEKNFSQEDIADRLGVSRQSVSKWESGLSNPDTENLIKLAQTLELPLETLTDTKAADSIQHNQGIALDSGPKKEKGHRINKAVFIAVILAVIVLPAIILLLNIRGKEPAGQTNAFDVTEVYFYDEDCDPIEFKDNWYTLTEKTIILVTYTGRADSISLYFTPTGTETGELREQVLVKMITQDSGAVLLQWTHDQSMIGHAQVALEQGDTSAWSDLYNVYYEQ